MKNAPRAAIENGFTAQFTKRVTPIPRQCWPTWRMAPKSTFMSIGMIISLAVGLSACGSSTGDRALSGAGIGAAAGAVGGALVGHFVETIRAEGRTTLLVDSGIHPRGLVTFFQKLMADRSRQPSQLETWFSTHPTTQERVDNVQAMSEQLTGFVDQQTQTYRNVSENVLVATENITQTTARGGRVAGEVEAAFARAGRVVLSNAKNYRMEPDVPLVIAEVNPRMPRTHGDTPPAPQRPQAYLQTRKRRARPRRAHGGRGPSRGTVGGRHRTALRCQSRECPRSRAAFQYGEPCLKW